MSQVPEGWKDSKAWKKFLSGVRSEATKELYSYRMTAFLESVKLNPDGFATLPAEVAEEKVQDYIDGLKARAERGEIAKATVRPSVTPIRAFCVMNKMRGVDWDILAKTVPTSKKYASDRAPSIAEVKALLNHAPLRLKAAILMQLSGGFRVGAFDYLSVEDVQDVKEGVAKVRIYRGEPEEYSCYISPEANAALKEYLEWRKAHGEGLTPDSPLFRDVFDAGRGSKGRAAQVKRMSSEVYGRDVNRLWHKAGVWRSTLDLAKGKKRQPFKATHGLRKAFKSIAEEHMKSLNVMRLMGHSTGVSGDSYYRPSEAEVLEDYMRAVPFLTVSAELRQKAEMEALEAKHDEGVSKVELELVKEREARRALQESLAPTMKALEQHEKEMKRMQEQIRQMALQLAERSGPKREK